jgi:putative hemolysin
MANRINIEEVIASKNPRLLKMLPGFALRYIKKILHEKEANEFLQLYGDRQGADFAKAVVEFFNIKLDLRGHDNIPATGGCIIASNHPLGGLDGIALIYAVSQKRPDLKFLVNDILMSVENLRPVFLPVNKLGRNSADILANLDRAYASGEAILIFPAGLVSRRQQGVVKDLEWKKSFIMQAKKNNIPVLPTFIAGENSNFFYSLSNTRKRIGVKANIEMFYLVDEMFQQKGRTITINFGKAVEAKTFDDTKSEKEWADMIKDQVYQLNR